MTPSAASDDAANSELNVRDVKFLGLQMGTGRMNIWMALASVVPGAPEYRRFPNLLIKFWEGVPQRKRKRTREEKWKEERGKGKAERGQRERGKGEPISAHTLVVILRSAIGLLAAMCTF